MTASGWRPDPTGRHELRYWDGTGWTIHVSDGPTTSTDEGAPDQAPPLASTRETDWAGAPRPMSTTAASGSSGKKVAAGVCGIIIGALGVHKFILGYTSEGLIMLLVAILGGLVTCGVATVVMGIIGLIEGIIYLTKSDQEFDAIYVYNKRGWF